MTPDLGSPSTRSPAAACRPTIAESLCPGPRVTVGGVVASFAEV